MKFRSIRVRTWLFLGVFFLAAVASFGQTLSDGGRIFADQLKGAGWTSISQVGPVSLKARRGRLCSNDMVNAVESAKELTAKQQLALLDVARIKIDEAGWLLGAKVAPGNYRLGLQFDRKRPCWVLLDAKGKELAKLTLVIFSESRNVVQASIAKKDGFYLLRLTCGGIVSVFRFVTEKAHNDCLKTLTQTNYKRIHLHSDVGDEDFLLDLAKTLEGQIDVQLELYGGKPPVAPFEIYIFKNFDAYARLDQIVTDGKFRFAGGFTSSLTDKAYFNPRLAPLEMPNGKLAYPLDTRASISHELNHAVAQRLRPGAIWDWADWLAEGLAELGVELSLNRRAGQDGEKDYQQIAGQVRHFQEIGVLPTEEDLSGGEMSASRRGFYAMAYMVCRRLHRDGHVRAILAANDQVRSARDSERAIRRVVNEHYGSFKKLYQMALQDALALEPSPAILWGFLEWHKKRMRVTSSDNKVAEIVLPQKHTSAKKFRLQFDFSFEDSRSNQVDIYFGFQLGRHLNQFMKISILPQEISMRQFYHGKWRGLGRVSYKKSLGVGDATELRWHQVTLSFVAGKKIRVELGNGRWATFDPPEYMPLVDGRLGVGTYNGSVWIRRIKFVELQ